MIAPGIRIRDHAKGAAGQVVWTPIMLEGEPPIGCNTVDFRTDILGGDTKGAQRIVPKRTVAIQLQIHEVIPQGVGPQTAHLPPETLDQSAGRRGLCDPG